MYCRQMFLDLEKMINKDKCEDVHFSLQELDRCDEILSYTSILNAPLD